MNKQHSGDNPIFAYLYKYTCLMLNFLLTIIVEFQIFLNNTTYLSNAELTV